ncbi:MAG TPA: hypothetical protein VIC08_02870 [Cellvibrionaceae bacterium]
MSVIEIVGYEEETNCEHCGRYLKHGIRISDGRVVGAQCLDKKLTKAREYQGKKYRFGAQHIIKIAKVLQWKSPSQWDRYGVNHQSAVFEAI